MARVNILLLIDAVFFSGFHHGTHIIRITLIDHSTTGKNVAAAFATYLDEFTAVFLDFLRLAFGCQ
jgi:hypothetical protein